MGDLSRRTTIPGTAYFSLADPEPWFKVTPDGWYRVGWKRYGEWRDPPVPWTECEQINPGSQTNPLRLMIREGRATVYINGRRGHLKGR